MATAPTVMGDRMKKHLWILVLAVHGVVAVGLIVYKLGGIQ